MANIYVTEFAGIGAHPDAIPAARDLLASQTVAIGATSASTSNALNAGTTVVRVYAEADCLVTLGAGTLNAANAPHLPLKEGTYDYLWVHLNSGWKVACIERTVS